MELMLTWEGLTRKEKGWSRQIQIWTLEFSLLVLKETLLAVALWRKLGPRVWMTEWSYLITRTSPIIDKLLCIICTILVLMGWECLEELSINNPSSLLIPIRCLSITTTSNPTNSLIFQLETIDLAKKNQLMLLMEFSSSMIINLEKEIL